MKYFVVSYDLHEDYDYRKLRELLESMDGEQLLESVWKLKLADHYSYIEVHRRLNELKDIDWDFVVAEIAQTNNQPIILKGPIR